MLVTEKIEASVLMIAPQFRPVVGGYERAAERLAQSLAASGVTVTVLTERRDHSWPKCESCDGYQIVRFWCVHQRRFHTLSSLLGLTLQLVRLGRRSRVWHAHQYGWHAAVAIMVGAVLRRPVLVKLTNTGAMGIAEATQKMAFGGLLQRVLRHAAGYVAVSSATAREAQAFGIESSRVFHVPNGVDAVKFSATSAESRIRARTELGLSCEGLVLFVGRLSWEKNPECLISAWQKASWHLTRGWRLAIVGDGPMRQHVADLVAERGLSDSILLAGAVSHPEAWYRAADIFVLSSRIEGLSNALLEAMSSALPVVATRVSGLDDTVERSRSGLLVPEGDANALADALVCLACNAQQRSEMGARGRELIENAFAIDRVASQMSQVYATAASSMKRGIY